MISATRPSSLPPGSKCSISTATTANRQVLHSISMAIAAQSVTALIGPSGSGKTTMLRSFNRINEALPGHRHTGEILIGGRSVFDRRLKLINLRKGIGMVFQKVNCFPRSIYENIVYGVRLSGNGGRRCWTRSWSGA